MDSRLINLLKILQERHGVFIGKKSLDHLVTFVSGYIKCIYDQDGVPPIFLPGFQEFVEMHYDISGNVHVFRHWSEIISFFSTTEEEAFDEFYKLLEVFLRL